MPLLNPLRPYMQILRWVLALAIPLALIGGGWYWGHRQVPALRDAVRQAADQREALAAQLDAHRTALAIANRGLAAAADSFRRISQAAKSEAAQADLDHARAVREAAVAVKAQSQLQADIAALNRTLQAERAGCVDAGRPVCGVPLE